MSWVLPRTVSELFRPSIEDKIDDGMPKVSVWNLSLLAAVWKLWLERNKEVLRNKSTEVEAVVDHIVWTVSVWASQSNEFVDVLLQDIYRSRPIVFEGGRREKIVINKLGPPS